MKQKVAGIYSHVQNCSLMLKLISIRNIILIACNNLKSYEMRLMDVCYLLVRSFYCRNLMKSITMTDEPWKCRIKYFVDVILMESLELNLLIIDYISKINQSAVGHERSKSIMNNRKYNTSLCWKNSSEYTKYC